MPAQQDREGHISKKCLDSQVYRTWSLFGCGGGYQLSEESAVALKKRSYKDHGRLTFREWWLLKSLRGGGDEMLVRNWRQ